MTAETLPDQYSAFVLQPEEGAYIENLGLRLLATGAQTDASLLVAVVTNPGPGGPPLHTHFDVDELYFVLTGQYRFKIRTEEFEGGPGTFVYAPRGTSHTFASTSGDVSRLLTVTLPGTDQFLQGISELQAQGVDQRAMAEHFRTFRSSIDGPPLMS